MRILVQDQAYAPEGHAKKNNRPSTIYRTYGTGAKTCPPLAGWGKKLFIDGQ